MTIPPTVRFPLKDGEYKPDYETLQKTFWLYCRHTSVTYITRLAEMFEAFTGGFEAYVAKDPNPGTLATFLQWCYSDLDDLKGGLTRLKSADHSGFKLIRNAIGFRQPFSTRVDEWNFEFIGRRGYHKPGVGLWTWMEKILPMNANVVGTLRGRKSYPLFEVSKFKYPAPIGGYPLGENKFVKTGDHFPVTGVWLPISLKGGCPNFFIRGELAPKAAIPVLRSETPAWSDTYVHHPPRTDFELGEFPTEWQLMWEDDRWRNGRDPGGEEGYLLGPDTDFPKDPPVALQDPSKPG